MDTQTPDKATVRRDLVAANQWAVSGGVCTVPAPRSSAWRKRNGWAMAAHPKTKTNGLSCCASCKRPFNPFVFLQERPHAHHPC